MIQIHLSSEPGPVRTFFQDFGQAFRDMLAALRELFG